MKYSKLLVSLIVGMNVVFAIAVLYIFFVTGAEPTSLIIAWFAFTTGELAIIAGIKKNKEKKEVEYDKLETKTYV